MAEGWVKKLKNNFFDVFSAGIEKHDLDPRAVKVMAEDGVDISKQRTKLIRDLGNIDFDYVVTICDNANQKCPAFPGKAKRIHHRFDNPPKIVLTAKSEEEIMFHYRRIRDEIKEFVNQMPDNL